MRIKHGPSWQPRVSRHFHTRSLTRCSDWYSNPRVSIPQLCASQQALYECSYSLIQLSCAFNYEMQLIISYRECSLGLWLDPAMVS